MTTETKRAAEASTAQIEEVTSVVLPEPQGSVVALEEAPAPLAEDIRKRMDEIDLRDSGSIVHFGTRAQIELQEISQ